EPLVADLPRHRFGRGGPVEDQLSVSGITALRNVHRHGFLAYGLEEPGPDPRARPVARDVVVRGEAPDHDLGLGGRARNEERNHSQNCYGAHRPSIRQMRLTLPTGMSRARSRNLAAACI